MKLNELTLGGYSARGDELTVSLAATVEEAAALDGEKLTVTSDDGEELEVFEGYVVASISVSGESVRVRLIRKVEESAEAAIRALEENVRIVRETATATQAVANEAKANANPQLATFAALTLPTIGTALTDEQALSIDTLWPEWSSSAHYRVDEVVRHSGQLYRCEQEHDAQADWTPDAAASLWSAITIAGDGVDVWVQPTGAHNAYNTGDRVHYPDADGPIYVSTIDGNTWAPDAYPQGWTKEA